MQCYTFELISFHVLYIVCAYDLYNRVPKLLRVFYQVKIFKIVSYTYSYLSETEKAAEQVTKIDCKFALIRDMIMKGNAYCLG